MTEGTKHGRGKSAKTKRREREERFFALVDRTQEMIERSLDEECGLKDLKQITGALKDLKDLLFEKEEHSGGNGEQMTIKIEGDVEEC